MVPRSDNSAHVELSKRDIVGTFAANPQELSNEDIMLLQKADEVITSTLQQ
ncbi:hypothetical protein CU097_006293 [Rhizopus azygosporus]|uniref:Uncharacterized protein n=1 Tax=Rhizopus azygosporus TaxID=86630 RepID=A0A367JA64_RHIAZ|nr:hypothetical protein CU097_006293 [Rhizopus azygosporus]